MNNLKTDGKGTILKGYHPAAESAQKYIASLSYDKLTTYVEAFSSCALSGNQLAEICAETLKRLMLSEPVSDRYLLGLAWEIKTMEEK